MKAPLPGGGRSIEEIYPLGPVVQVLFACQSLRQIELRLPTLDSRAISAHTSETNLSAVLAVLKDPRERAMVLLSLKAGLRATEIPRLTWGRIRGR